MALADRLRNTANKLMNRFNVSDRTVYKRFYTRTGGDSLIGRPGTVTYTEEVFDPPPIVNGLDINFGDKPRDTQLLVNNVMMVTGDYLVTTTPTAISQSEISDKDFVVVLKDSSGVEEELHLVTYEREVVNGQVVLYIMLLRSKGR